MKEKKIVVSCFALLGATLGLTACQNNSVKPLWEEAKDSESKTSLIISDLHLGIDSSFAENVANVPYLVQFINRARATANLDEIVLAGDVLDGWFLPFSYGVVKDYTDFYQKAAKANQGVVDAINAIIKEGRIKVVYVPGNHDVDLTKSILESIFPNISQARDSDGVGTYRTGLRNEIAIEHGHRYNVFCAPDPLTDVTLRQGKTLLGPGYFYTRLAATSLKTGHPARSFAFPDFGMPENASEEVKSAYLLYVVWERASSTIGVEGMTFESKVIPCGIAGYADYYSLADLVPLYRNGALTNTLFMDIAKNWSDLQKRNKVNTVQEYAPAVLESAKLEATDQKALQDYFSVDPTVDVVVFGHTHAPLLDKNITGYPGKIYANSGTWIDHNIDDDNGLTRTFVKVVSSKTGDQASLYTYAEDGALLLKAE